MNTKLTTLKTLTAFPTVTGDYAANHVAFEYIDGFLRERGMHVARYEFGGFESLVATTRRTKTPTVMFLGHIDVVPAEPEQFKLQEKDGKLFGRGMIDMKASIAAFLDVVESLGDTVSQYDFGIMIVSDEEFGGFNGAVPLLKEGYAPKVCVIPDGGRDWALETFAKGLSLFDVTVSGRSAHGSRPWEGDSANDKLLRLVAEVQTLFPNPGWNTSTCTLSQLRGGEAVNQVAASATASFDIRFASIEDEKNLTNAINLICQAYGATTSNQITSAPTVNDPENPYLRSFLDSLEKGIGYPPGTTISNAGTDGRFFAAKGIPCAIFYPAGGGHHGPEEWIPVEAYFQMQAIFRDYLEKEARMHVTGQATPNYKVAPELEIAHS